MKYLYIISIIGAFLLLTQCQTQKDIKLVMREMSKNIPEGNTEAAGQLDELQATYDRGYTLFKLNCSGCHGIFTSGRDSIPNFTNEQIDNYGVSAIRRDPTNHSVAMKMSQEQINDVLSFLFLRNLAKQARAAKKARGR